MAGSDGGGRTVPLLSACGHEDGIDHAIHLGAAQGGQVLVLKLRLSHLTWPSSMRLTSP